MGASRGRGRGGAGVGQTEGGASRGWGRGGAGQAEGGASRAGGLSTVCNTCNTVCMNFEASLLFKTLV